MDFGAGRSTGAGCRAGGKTFEGGGQMKWIPNTFDFPVVNEEGEVVGMEKRTTEYHARFTDDEKNQIRRCLKKSPPEKVELFIRLLPEVCTKYMIFLQQKRDAEIKSVIKGIIPALSDAQSALKELVNPNSRLAERLKTVNCLVDPHLSKIAYADVPIYSKKALEYLELLIESLEKIKPDVKRGRPQTEGGFAQAVADKFLEVFGENAPKSETGVFNDILTHCLDWMGLDHENVGRRIKATVHK
jgi:hypothetical protein